MKSLMSYLAVAALILSTASMQATTIVRAKSNISNNIIVKCTSCSPQTASTQPATADRNGNITVFLDKPGTYAISAADGAKKGEVLQTVTVSKAGRMSLSVKLAAAE